MSTVTGTEAGQVQIVNELATNSLKYAHVGRDGGVLGLRVEAHAADINLTIRDDGPGIDPEARVDSGLDRKLVAVFVEQWAGY